MTRHVEDFHDHAHLTDSRVTGFLRQYYTPADRRLIPFRYAAEMEHIPVIMRETESVLSLLLEMQNPGRILEIGTAIGYSSCFFAVACPKAEIWSIEKDPDAIRSARANLERAGVSGRVHLCPGDGCEIVPVLRKNGIEGFGFVFLDASKSRYGAFLDAALPSAAPGALIVSDNIFQQGMTLSETFDAKGKHRANARQMRAFVDRICSEPALHTALLPVGDGLAVSRLRNSNRRDPGNRISGDAME